jgi:hypothetical protein
MATNWPSAARVDQVDHRLHQAQDDAPLEGFEVRY